MNDLKYQKLLDELRSLSRVALLFSGGVDSALLLYALRESGVTAMAITIDSDFLSRAELATTRELAARYNIAHKIIRVEISDVAEIMRNDQQRCYYCKRHFIETVKKNTADQLIDGTNADDEMATRPGMKALHEADVKSPLHFVDLHKTEIREISRAKNIAGFARFPNACLATRIATNTPIDLAHLQKIERAESFLSQCNLDGVRVRLHGDNGEIARIETQPNDLKKIVDDLRDKIVDEFTKIGFTKIAVDLAGYR